MPQLVPALKRRPVVVWAVLGFALAGCLQEEPSFIPHPTWIRVDHAQDLSHYGDDDPRIHANRSDLETSLPFFANALDSAKRDGRATIEGEERVQAVFAYIDRNLGREYRGDVLVELEGSYFAVWSETA